MPLRCDWCLSFDHHNLYDTCPRKRAGYPRTPIPPRPPAPHGACARSKCQCETCIANRRKKQKYLTAADYDKMVGKKKGA